MKFERKLILGFLIIVLVGFVQGQVFSGMEGHEIIRADIGGHILYIPQEYVRLHHASIGNESALLQAWYPGAGLVPGKSPNQLLKQGEWWKNIAILVALIENSDVSFSEFVRRSTEHLDATELIGEEFGLLHFTQPEGFVKDKYDVWLEPNSQQVVSYVTCSEKMAEYDEPQCAHVFYWDEAFRIKVSFNRRLLVDWSIIKSNVLTLLESFKSPVTAREFVHSQLQ